jgi:hypothetical protein
MRRPGSLRLLAVAALALALGLGAAPAAVGHASQTGSTPAAGSVLAEAPTTVEVTFDTPVMDIGAALVVRSAAGDVVSEGAPTVQRTSIRLAVAPDAGPGTYSVAFRVVAEDGHAITSTFDYTVAGDPTASSVAASPDAASSTAPALPTVTPAPDDPPAGPPLALIAAGLLVLTLIVAGAIALR